MRRNACAIAAAVCVLLARPAGAELVFYDNESAWRAASQDIEDFDTTSSNVALANEIGPPPAGNHDLGSVLTWEAASTGRSRGFVLMSLNIPPAMGRGLVFDDSEAGLGGPRNISIGDADGVGNPATRILYENDDWQLDILSGPDLTAFGFTIVGNNESIAESMSFYNGATLIGSVTDLATTNNVRFLGVVTTEPITRVVFDEDEIDPGPDFDDIAIRDFRFGSKRTEPTAVEAVSWGHIKVLFR